MDVWKSCVDILQAGKATVVMSRLPFFWQLAVPLYNACTTIGVVPFLNQPDNMPLGAAAIRSAGINAILSTPEDAAAFSLFLLEQNVPVPPTWLLIYDAAAASWDIPAGLDQVPLIAQEVHLSPGMPLLVQCPTQAKEKAGDFHLSKDLLPLESYQLPFAVAESGMCACGEKNYKRI